MGNSSSSSESPSSYGMVVRDAESPFAPPRGVFRRKGDDGGVHLVRGTDGVAGETRRSVSRYDVTCAKPSMGGQPGTFTRTGSFINPQLFKLKFDDERFSSSSSSKLNSNDANVHDNNRNNNGNNNNHNGNNNNNNNIHILRGSPATSSRNSFISFSSFGEDEEIAKNEQDTRDSINNNNNDNNASNARCLRCVERRSKTHASNENVAKQRRLTARNTLFDSGRGGEQIYADTVAVNSGY